MIPTNLIPEHRLTARRRRRRVRQWVAVSVVYSAAILLAGLVTAATTYAGGDPEKQIAQAAERIEQNKLSETQLSSELLTAQNELAAVTYVAERPDWNVLLAVISVARGDDVVLSKVSLALNDRSGSSHNQKSFIIQMTGHGQTQAAVSAFALRLEQEGLFSDVKVQNARREPYGSAAAIRFDLQCRIGQEGATP